MSNFLELDSGAEGGATVAPAFVTLAENGATPAEGLREAGATVTAEEGVSLAEAASILGVSIHQARRMVKSGKLAAVQVDGPRGKEYRVSLGALADAGRQGGARPAQASRQGDGATVADQAGVRLAREGGARVTESGATVAVLLQQLEHLRAENSWLRGRVESAEVREADLRQQLETALRALEREQQRRMPWQAVSEPVEPTPRRWWGWWRR